MKEVGKEPHITGHPAAKAKKKRRLRRWLIVIGVLVLIRLCLPFIILHFANQKLANLDGYYGHIDDIDLALIRGAYTIDDIFINKVDKNGKDFTEFFSCKEIDLSVEWRAIFEGKIVGEVEFDEPVVKYTMDETVGKKAEKDSTSFIQLIKDFMPLDINHFAVNNGQVHYIDNGRVPAVDVPLTAMYIDGKGLTNNPEEGVLLPASIDMNAKLYNGDMNVGVKLDPLNESPTFDLNAKLTETQLTYLNPFFKAYGNFDLTEGKMELYTEVAAKKGEFTGYVKPIITDLDIVQFNKSEGSLGQIAWEALVGSVAEIFQNQRKEQLATKVMLNGKFSDPKVQTLDAVVSLLRNAFIQALRPTIENTINLSAVGKEEEEKKGFFKRLFSDDEKEKTETTQDQKDDKQTEREQQKKEKKDKKRK